ncbi:hypothetical protein GHT06_016142 [Daphnia sinensis]|uniref:Uncharacterized protein n=1 Tax=Daphnia sinensis TaxID=1820382 RepID=A0AAD5LKD6_9CRUS|nr:hypothetical protein GHT06_016142 [Daphnia sinensis]
MQNNFNLRMGTPRLVNSQPRLMRPTVNLNYIPNNFNNQTGYGYVQQYSAAGLSYRAPVYQNVHQSLSEDYQQPYGTQLVNYVEMQDSAQLQNPQWSQSDYFQYLEERANHPQVHSQPNYQPFSNQVDHSARFLQRTAAIAPPFIRQPQVPANNKYGSNSFGSTSGGYRQQTQKNRSQNAKIPRKQNQPMAMLPPPKPVHRRADQPVQNLAKKPKISTGSRVEAQQKAQTKPNQPKQNDNKMQPTQQGTVIKKELYLHVGKVERDRALVGTIPQLFKWRSARHRFPPIYETVGTIDGRQNAVDKKQKIEDQFIVRNMKQWNCNTGPSVKELIECVMYSSVHRQAKFSVGTCVRIVGRYIPDSEMFHCLKIRQATESDLNRLTCIVKSLAARSVYMEPLLSVPVNSEENYEEPEESTANDSYVPAPVPMAESDFLFQPY